MTSGSTRGGGGHGDRGLGSAGPSGHTSVASGPVGAAPGSTGRSDAAIAKVLSIAGSDPSGGAGIQADLKTFSALGAYGMCVLTAATAQSTTGVTGVHAIPAPFVAEQLGTLVADITPDAVKIGMLADVATIEVVGAFIDELGRAPGGVDAVVLDPVMVATSGDRLVSTQAGDALRDLIPRVGLITPNVPEAAVLLDTAPATDLDELQEQATQLLLLGARRVLLKGGHVAGERAVDIYADEDGQVDLAAPFVDTRNTHGTGCSLSSAVAALLPQRASWLDACRDAKVWLTGALANADRLNVGHGHGPVHHYHQWW